MNTFIKITQKLEHPVEITINPANINWLIRSPGSDKTVIFFSENDALTGIVETPERITELMGLIKDE